MFSQLSTLLVASLALSTSAFAQDAPKKFDFGNADPNAYGVKSRNNNGPTNPDSPKMGTPINQTSDARLASVNSIDDWCTFGPNQSGQPLGNIEGETVAWCTKPRNNARVIPDGTLTAVHFVKTPLYVQVMAMGDFTKLDVMPGDEGGELDPHGATNMGNPVGGNVTSNVSGQDEFYEEWMNYISYNQVCMRVCIAGSDIAPTPLECQHEIDELGCNWVMPGDYSDQKFDTCDGDAAYPPGLFPQGDGSTSTFHQYFSSVYTAPDGGVQTFVNGSPDQQTPSAAYSLPSTSNCKTGTSVANGIASLAQTSSSAASGMSSAKGSQHSSGSSSNSNNDSEAAAAGSGGASGASALQFSATILAVVGVFAGAIAIL